MRCRILSHHRRSSSSHRRITSSFAWTEHCHLAGSKRAHKLCCVCYHSPRPLDVVNPRARPRYANPSTLTPRPLYATPRRQPLDPYTPTPIRNPYTQTLDPLRKGHMVSTLDPYTLYPRPLYASPSTPRRFTLDPLRTGLKSLGIGRPGETLGSG